MSFNRAPLETAQSAAARIADCIMMKRGVGEELGRASNWKVVAPSWAGNGRREDQGQRQVLERTPGGANDATPYKFTAEPRRVKEWVGRGSAGGSGRCAKRQSEGKESHPYRSARSKRASEGAPKGCTGYPCRSPHPPPLSSAHLSNTCVRLFAPIFPRAARADE